MPWQLALTIGENDLEEDFKVRSPSGQVLCTIGLTATLYIEHGDTPEVREGMLRAYEQCLRWAGRPFTWGADPTTGDPLSVAQTGVGDVRAWPPATLQYFDFQMLFTGAADVDDADGYSFLAVSREREEDELSYLSMSLPLEWATRHSPGEYISIVQELCALVGPAHGYAGPAIIGHAAGNDDEATAAIFSLARSYRGLDVDFPPQHAPYLATEGHIKGINWLTILGSTLEAQLGGYQTLSETLSPMARLLAFSSASTGRSGSIVQVGDRPLAGAVKTKEPMHGYEAVARHLLPIRTVNPAVIWPQDAPGFDFDESAAWMRRFDVP
jgi:hypothetical protein